MKTNKTKGSRCVSWNLQDLESISVFETMRAYGRKIFRLEEHLDRLEESAKTVGIELPLKREEIKEKLESELHGHYTNSSSPHLNNASFPHAFRRESTNKDPRLTPCGDDETLTYGNDESISIRLSASSGEIVVMIPQRKMNAELYRTGVRLRTSPVKRSLSNASPPEAKTTDYMNAVMATLEPSTHFRRRTSSASRKALRALSASAKDIYEWLFLDRNGYVTEVRIGNIFVVEPRGLVTPPTPGILNGVTRRVVLECARDLEIPVSERPLTRHEIFNASEAFLTNTSWEILPISELDGRRIPNRIPGPVTKKLHEQFKRKVQSECR